MDSFDQLLNWTLKSGSHPFPGQDGGTCINEAALVAAGFEYKRINSVKEMPECFSRPICHLALVVNDQASDRDRQRLLPYVTRLACADTPEVERKRATHIYRRTHGYAYGLPFEASLEVLEEALALGRAANPFASDEVQTRLDVARATAKTSPRAPDRPVWSKVKTWLVKGEVEPAG
jgi:hypothetical protein